MELIIFLLRLMSNREVLVKNDADVCQQEISVEQEECFFIPSFQTDVFVLCAVTDVSICPGETSDAVLVCAYSSCFSFVLRHPPV